MAQQCGFFNAEYHDGEYDRVYNAEQFAAYFASFIGNGIFGDSMEELVVLARTENNMSVDVSTGQAWINGWWYRNDETLNMPIALADGILNRKDIVVLRWGNAERDMWLQVVQGEPSIEAVPPVIRRDADYFDLELCEIDVPAGTSKITQALIKDTRLDNNVCGFVTGVVDQIDTTALYLQFNAQFNDWFEAVKEQFEGDVPQILQSQIDALFEMVTSRIESTSTSTRPYSVTDLFIYNKKLCKATAAIAIGDTISPGTESGDNCIYTNIIDEIGTGGGSVTVVEELADIEAMTVFNGEAAGAKAVKNLSLAFSSALTSLKATPIAQVVGATGNTFAAVIQKLNAIVVRQNSPNERWKNSSGRPVTNISNGGARGACSDGTVRTVVEVPTGYYQNGKDLIGITDLQLNQLGGFVRPSGNKHITANGSNIDVKANATVSVAVPQNVGYYLNSYNRTGAATFNLPSGYKDFLIIAGSSNVSQGGGKITWSSPLQGSVIYNENTNLLGGTFCGVLHSNGQASTVTIGTAEGYVRFVAIIGINTV